MRPVTPSTCTAATSITAPLTEKDEWQVDVFRRTLTELHHVIKGCVEIKKLRIRIHLCQNNNDSTTTATKDSENELDEKASTTPTTNTYVVRRKDTILLSTRKGGAVVVKFLEASQRRQDIKSYIVRLLHNDSFLQFVDDVEATVKETLDGVKILSAAGSVNSANKDIGQGAELD